VPYWLAVLHDAVATVMSSYVNGLVFFFESMGVTHDAAVSLTTDVTVVGLGGIVVAVGAKIRSGLKRGAEEARRRLNEYEANHHPAPQPAPPVMPPEA
jgi:predicted PurR-regulated permease PerM